MQIPLLLRRTARPSRLLPAVLLAISGSCETLSLTQEPGTEWSRPGAYVGAGVSIVDENFDAFEDVSHDADETQPGFNGRAGYRVHPRLSVEAALQTYAPFDVEINGFEDGEVEGWAVTGNVRYHFATGRFQPYAFGGVGYADTDNSSGVGEDGGDTSIVGGAGADYYFTPQVALYLELAYHHPTGDTDEFDFIPLTLGLSYRF